MLETVMLRTFVRAVSVGKVMGAFMAVTPEKALVTIPLIFAIFTSGIEILGGVPNPPMLVPII
jgi:hypothetical protein